MGDSSESGLDVFADLVRKPAPSSPEGEGSGVSRAGRAPFASDPKSEVKERSKSDTSREESEQDPPEAPVESAAQLDADNEPSESRPADPLEGILATPSRVVPPAARSPIKQPPPAASAGGRPPSASSSDESLVVLTPAPSTPEAAPRPPPPSARGKAAPQLQRASRRPPPPSSMGFGAGRSTPLPAQPRLVVKAPDKRPSSKNVGVAVALVVGVLVAGGSAIFALQPSSGTLIVSASGPNGRALPSVATFVDGVKRCDASPCRIEGLSDGVHIVEARAPGHISIAGKAVKVEAGDEVPFDLELREDDPPASGTVKTKDPRATEAKQGRRAGAKTAATTSVDDLPAAPGAKAQPHADTGAPPAPNEQVEAAPGAVSEADSEKPQAARATLNFNSVPASNVVLDGRPLGRTPQMGVSVRPGSHSVVFIHPTHGRKANQVAIEAGEAKTAVVRFP